MGVNLIKAVFSLSSAAIQSGSAERRNFTLAASEAAIVSGKIKLDMVVRVMKWNLRNW